MNYPMKPTLYILLLTSVKIILCSQLLVSQEIEKCNVKWMTPSKSSQESMPCGGGDIGVNVWVEDGDVLFLFSRSGTFDENNTLLKLGRVRVHLTPNPFSSHFSQELKLEDGNVVIKGQNGEHRVEIKLWVDILKPIIHLNIESVVPIKTDVYYENWRYENRLLRPLESNQNSYKWAAPKTIFTAKDSIFYEGNSVCFYHQNTGRNVVDTSIIQQGLGKYKNAVVNPLRNLIFGGKMEASGFVNKGVTKGTYAGTSFRAWKLSCMKPRRKSNITIYLHTQQVESWSVWKLALDSLEKSFNANIAKKQNSNWWKQFWNRSFIYISQHDTNTAIFNVGRNYQLFRYMLACNAYGTYPTKFNGGLFTFDPINVDSSMAFTPDFRKWGGGTFTAQNQRLVYYPMLRSGDYDMMLTQFDFYSKLLPTAELRSKVYWNHAGACFSEQLENCGLPNPSEYGWKRPDYFDRGVEYNAWLEYQWDTVLEFCYMILDYQRYSGNDISRYMPLIKSVLIFFDEHYQYLAKRRGRKPLDENGKLILYPGSACETYKMATNSTSTIAALRTVITRLLALPCCALDTVDRTYFRQLLVRIPEIHIRKIDEHSTIAPALLWERTNNVECPQLYPVYPWGIYGVNKPHLDVALNTWKYDKDVQKFKTSKGWKQYPIWAARLGLIQEADSLIIEKLGNSKNRFPAFWGPGYDWTPDHNWGGSGMIALQEMLMQTDDKHIYLFPTWDASWNVHFKLYAPYNTTVECELENGKIKQLKVMPEKRRKDLVIQLKNIKHN